MAMYFFTSTHCFPLWMCLLKFPSRADWTLRPSMLMFTNGSGDLLLQMSPPATWLTHRSHTGTRSYNTKYKCSSAQFKSTNCLTDIADIQYTSPLAKLSTSSRY